MEKNLFKVILITIIILNPLLELFAQDTYSFKIGCVIPAIPGVNAPLEEETEYIQKEDKSQINTHTDGKNDDSTEDSEEKLLEKEKLSFQEKTEDFILKTYYSR